VTAPFVSERFSTAHLTAGFASGKPELDAWLNASAAHAQANRTARTFVWHRGDPAVVAYFSLAATLARRDELPKRIGRGSPDHIPAVLLARLALDQSLHGHGLGAQLLRDALGRVVAVTELVGARILIVDAIDEAAARFYERYGFTRATPRRLCQKVSDIVAALR